MGRDVGLGAKSLGTNRRTYPNAPFCMKAYISHKIHYVFKFAGFLFLKTRTYMRQETNRRCENETWTDSTTLVSYSYKLL